VSWRKSPHPVYRIFDSNSGVPQSALHPPKEAVIRSEQTIHLSLFSASQMQRVEGSVAEHLKNIRALKRRIAQNDSFRGCSKEFQHRGTKIAVRVFQDFRLQNFARDPSCRSMKNMREELLDGV
jgi:hypothetical protein